MTSEHAIMDFTQSFLSVPVRQPQSRSWVVVIIQPDPHQFVFVKKHLWSQCSKYSHFLLRKRFWPCTMLDEVENCLQILVLVLQQLQVRIERVK
jgi:hypothetical protein